MTVTLSFICFLVLFLFRYTRLVVSIFAYLRYRPTPVNEKPLYLPSDVTAVIPSIDCAGPAFEATVKSALSAGVAEVIVVTISNNLERAEKNFQAFGKRIRVLACSFANKRAQVCIGLRQVETDIVLLMDDHVWFNQPKRFIDSVLAPFRGPAIGGVAVGKKVKRLEDWPMFSAADILNAIACVYLDRHNFDLAASNTVDGGVFVISGRAAAYRSSIVCDPAFMAKFCDEFWFFGVGPLHADDDNFLTRYVINKGFKIKFQYSPDATMWTVLGVEGFEKFLKQCVRWSRTTWRSNSTSLLADGTVWRTQPWCVYAVYISSFFNFALFTDLSLLWLCKIASLSAGPYNHHCTALLALWIFASKLVKLIPHLQRCPWDVFYVPIFIAFGYYHSFIKLWSLVTVNSLSWGSRPNVVP